MERKLIFVHGILLEYCTLFVVAAVEAFTSLTLQRIKLGRFLTRIAVGPRANSISWSNDGTLLLVVWKNQFCVYSRDDWKQVLSESRPNAIVAWNPIGTELFVATKGASSTSEIPAIMKMSNGKLTLVKRFNVLKDSKLHDASWDIIGEHIATLVSDGNLVLQLLTSKGKRVWHSEILSDIENATSLDQIKCLFSPNGQYIAVIWSGHTDRQDL